MTRRTGKGFWRTLWSKLGEGESIADAPESQRRDRENDVVDSLARDLSRAGFGSAGIFVAESAKPVAWLAGQALHFFAPSLGLLLGTTRMSNLACVLEDRENLERFARKLEELEDARAGRGAGRSEPPNR